MNFLRSSDLVLCSAEKKIKGRMGEIPWRFLLRDMVVRIWFCLNPTTYGLGWLWLEPCRYLFIWWSQMKSTIDWFAIGLLDDHWVKISIFFLACSCIPVLHLLAIIWMPTELSLMCVIYVTNVHVRKKTSTLGISLDVSKWKYEIYLSLCILHFWVNWTCEWMHGCMYIFNSLSFYLFN